MWYNRFTGRLIFWYYISPSYIIIVSHKASSTWNINFWCIILNSRYLTGSVINVLDTRKILLKPKKKPTCMLLKPRLLQLFHQVVDHHGADLHSQVEEVVVVWVEVAKVVQVFKVSNWYRKTLKKHLALSPYYALQNLAESYFYFFFKWRENIVDFSPQTKSLIKKLIVQCS